MTGEKVWSPEDVEKLTQPTKGFLCKLSANAYGIDFQEFKIRDYENNRVVFEVQKGPEPPLPPGFDLDSLPDDVRYIRYNFDADFLKIRTVGTTLVFSVGPKELKNFRMIERHYFKNRLIKSYDFNFGFCIPNSTNSWEAIYEMPELPTDLIREMITSPYETKSDSFYFVDGQLVMHNKAEYAYHVKE
eukprot:TRINITY_DN15583_c0_g1::TRINITY_DN15583_c0_g1_i1::g.28568::m.28568 TRINITY_DN15583_c0_g1::TRINITY_DN15583_c0_g1_i1::g.28568  ORF type:complete len:188 (-),score=14.89,sp/Q90Z08/U119B_DANRE/55.14/6e-65,GMP_PDE_delta/PF05351.6/3.2e-63 TRINITY_DN15583_c0_g1_i1:129-692(-)